jgi:exosome complex RNA-binding protein Rrp42 (RNase PH superfamily)
MITQVTCTSLATVEANFSDGNAQGAALTHLLSQHLFSRHVIDMRQLCIAEGKNCWQLQLDVYVLNDDGSILDTCMAAATSALASLQVRCQVCFCSALQANLIAA